MDFQKEFSADPVIVRMSENGTGAIEFGPKTIREGDQEIALDYLAYAKFAGWAINAISPRVFEVHQPLL